MVRKYISPGKPIDPKYFAGRQEEVQTILSQIHNKGHIIVKGFSGVGKSSLLTYIENKLTGQLTVYYNCAATEVSNFWVEVLKEIVYVTEDYPDIQNHVSTILKNKTIDSLQIKKLIKYINNSGINLILLLDDFGEMFQEFQAYKDEKELQETNNFLRDFRTIIQSKLDFATVLTSSKNITTITPKPNNTSEWFNPYIFVDLKPFTPAEVYKYFLSPDNPLYIPIPEYLHAKEILNITGTFPFILIHARYILSRENAPKTIEEFKYQLGLQTSFKLLNIFNSLSSIEKEYLANKATNTLSKNKTIHDDIVQSLISKGIFISNKKSDFIINSSIMKNVIINWSFEVRDR